MWLYVTLTGLCITLRHILKKSESLRNEPKYMVLVFDVPPLNYCFEADVMDFFSGRSLVERFNSADQINLLVACTADCTCHHASD